MMLITELSEKHTAEARLAVLSRLDESIEDARLCIRVSQSSPRTKEHLEKILEFLQQERDRLSLPLH